MRPTRLVLPAIARAVPNHCTAHPPPTKYALPAVSPTQTPAPQGGREVVNVVAMVVAVMPVVVVLVGHPEAVVAGVLGWSPGWSMVVTLMVVVVGIVGHTPTATTRRPPTCHPLEHS